MCAHLLPGCTGVADCEHACLETFLAQRTLIVICGWNEKALWSNKSSLFSLALHFHFHRATPVNILSGNYATRTMKGDKGHCRLRKKNVRRGAERRKEKRQTDVVETGLHWNCTKQSHRHVVPEHIAGFDEEPHELARLFDHTSRVLTEGEYGTSTQRNKIWWELEDEHERETRCHGGTGSA